MTGTRSAISLPAAMRSVTEARRFVRELLLDWGLAELVDDAQLGVCELVANAVGHAGSAVEITVSLGDEVTVRVSDRERHLDRGAAPAPEQAATSGRGLQIVEAISTGFGVEPAADGKTVWFTLALPAAGDRDADVVDLAGTARSDPYAAGDVGATAAQASGGVRAAS